jgi:hypothetical protein
VHHAGLADRRPPTIAEGLCRGRRIHSARQLSASPPHRRRRTPAEIGSEPAPPADRKGDRTVNKVLLTGRLTRDPELRVLASGKSVCTFNVATNEYAGNGKEKAEYHSVVAWDTRPVGRIRLAHVPLTQRGGR